LAIQGFDPNLLLGFFQARLPQRGATQLATTRTTSRSGATANDIPPWEVKPLPQAQQDANVLATKDFLDTSKVPLTGTSTADGKTEQDNQKLFALYQAVNTLANLAKIGQREGTGAGQLTGLNTRFQQGLQQVEAFIANAKFNNFTLQAASQTDVVTSTAGVQPGSFSYATRTLVNNANVDNPLPGISAGDSFTIVVKKGQATTNVTIDLSQVQGGLTLGNIVSYVNEQLSAAGFSSRLRKVVTSGSLEVPAKASFGLQVVPGGIETIAFTSATTRPALYLAGSSGAATAKGDVPADQQGRLLKLSDLDTAPRT